MIPLHDYVLVRPLPQESRSIVLPDAYRPPPDQGIAEATGPEVRFVRPGHRLLLAQRAGQVADETGRLLVREIALLAILDDGP